MSQQCYVKYKFVHNSNSLGYTEFGTFTVSYGTCLARYNELCLYEVNYVLVTRGYNILYVGFPTSF